MKKFRYALTVACLSFFTRNNNSLASGPTIELIASDESSHVCKIGIFTGWNALSGTSTFNKLVDFQTTKNQTVNNENLKFKSNWLNYNAGLHFGYTRFFNRQWGWNVFDIRGGYNRYATYSAVNSPENSLTYHGFIVDVMSGVAYNFKKDGLDFEEGNQFGDRLVLNFNGGINFNFCSFTIKGKPDFTENHLDAFYDGTTQWWRIVFEPSLEWIARNGFLAKFATNMNYLGPWKSEKNQADEFYLPKNKVQKLPGTISIAPTVELGWDFSALIN